MNRPIIFSGPMVRALLAGRKTQTRRLAASPLRGCEAGDRLYVREHWRTPVAYDDLAPRELGGEEAVLLIADGAIERLRAGDRTTLWGKQRQGMHMPRWASRLTLIVEGVRVEPLQVISEVDAWAEGVDDPYLGDGDPPFEEQAVWVSCKMQFRNLWNSLHTEPSERWEDNPSVVALTFRVELRNIDQA